MKNIGIAIRSLFKRGQHNVMKIISLGIGLTIGLVLIAKVHFENTYDNFYSNGDRIYRVYEKFFMNGEVGDHGQTPAGVIPLLKQETPRSRPPHAIRTSGETPLLRCPTTSIGSKRPSS